MFIISADTSAKSLSRAFDLGAEDVISKPFNINFVRKRINNIIELYKLREIFYKDEDDIDDELM